MKHRYSVSGMTCEGCVAKVSHLLNQIPEVKSVDIDLDKGEATLEMSKHVATPTLQDALKDYPKYKLTEQEYTANTSSRNIFEEVQPVEDNRSWAATYKPIILIFGYITVISVIVSYSSVQFDIMLFMRTFMAGFFLIFSFFKMLDLNAFANSYSMYDIVAKKFKSWGYIYAFIELGLGLAFAINFEPVFTNVFTAIVMSISLIGVLQSVLNKKKIQCACLGAVFNLPMSTVTIIEDALMILMSIAMLIMYS